MINVDRSEYGLSVLTNRIGYGSGSGAHEGQSLNMILGYGAGATWGAALYRS